MRSAPGSGLPSTMIRSARVTFSAGEAIFSPFTATRPAAIQASASRREQSPARAMTLAMRSPSCVLILRHEGLMPQIFHG